MKSDYGYLLKNVYALTEPDYYKLNKNNHRLLHAVLCAYAKHHLGIDSNLGWDKLSDILFNAITEEIGDKEFVKWMEVMRPESLGGDIL